MEPASVMLRDCLEGWGDLVFRLSIRKNGKENGNYCVI